MTMPTFFVEEDQILTALFDEGLDILHLRKPGTEPVYSERLLTLLPSSYRKRIVVHDHFYLKDEYGLKGVHLNHRNPEIPVKYKGQVTCSCHSFEEIKQYKKNFDYMFLSPVFSSISKENYPAAFSDESLRIAAKNGIIDKKVVALGGVTPDNIAKVRDYGFGGVVILGDLWNRFNIHTTQDFKDIITYFRRLKRLVN